ncbi:MAG: 4-hydroxy-tetrahydrodipicolinate synthase [Dictyoglomaceae bacterium]|nr:4-hydroxy-tetrahydrodipicolinate synthase [Dictyoglomaceae bacterium]
MTFKPYGILPAMVTPFNEREELNEPILKELVEYLIKNGVHGLFIIGSQGEFYALTKEEKKKIIEIVVEKVEGRVPVYAGTGAITTKEVIELNKYAEDVGVDAVSIITPYFISPSQNELYEHYKEIAKSTNLPVLLYNNPQRCGVNLSANLIEKLADIDNIVGIKDSSGDLTLTSEYIRRTQGKNFHVLAGRDTLILATLFYGGTGAIAACANVAPKLVSDIYNFYVQGELEKAKEAQQKLAPLRIAFELGTFPVVIKEALNIMGIPVGPCRGPVKGIDEEKKKDLRNILQSLNLV